MSTFSLSFNKVRIASLLCFLFVSFFVLFSSATLVNAAVPTVTSQPATGVDDDEATFNGTLVDDGGLTVTERGFQYGVTSNYGGTTTESGGPFSTGSFLQYFGALTCANSYNYRAYAINADGVGYGTNIFLLTDDCVVPPLVISNDGAVSATSTATLYASATVNEGPAIERGFVYGTSPGVYTATTSESGSFSTQSFERSISGLSDGVTYYFRAFIRNADTIVYSSQSFFTTRSAALLTISTPGSDQITDTTAIVYGNVVEAGNPATTVGFSYGTSPGVYTATTSESGSFDPQNVNSFSEQLTGLTPETTYYYRAYGSNGLTLAYGDEETFETRRAPITVEISDCTELQAIDDDTAEGSRDIYLLTNDIDCTGVNFTPLAWDDYFSGVFDGQGHKITNLDIDTLGQFVQTGLIANLKYGARIRNLGLEGIVQADGSVGFLSGYVGGFTEISNVHATGTVSDGGGGNGAIGGLIGSIELQQGFGERATIASSSFSGDISGYDRLGGLVGYFYADIRGILELTGNSVSGTITGDGGVTGGLVGQMESYIYDIPEDEEVLVNVYQNHVDLEIETTHNEVGGLFGNLYLAHDNAEDSIFTVRFDQNFIEGNIVGDNNVGGMVGVFTSTQADIPAFTHTIYSTNNKVTAGLVGLQNVGGLYGLSYVTNSSSVVGAMQSILSNNIVLGDIEGDMRVGGLVGNLQEVTTTGRYVVSYNVVAAPLFANDDYAALFTTDDISSVTLTDNWYDSTTTTVNDCYLSDGVGFSNSNCQAQSNSAYFKGTSSVAPFTSWNFGSIWEVLTDEYPLLRYFESDTPIDVIAPNISAINAVPADTTSVITWTTDEVTSSRVVYSTDMSFSIYTAITDTAPRVTSHTVNLSSLATCTTYNYKVVSTDGNSNTATSSAQSFVTTGCPVDGGDDEETDTTTTVISNTSSPRSGSRSSGGTVSSGVSQNSSVSQGTPIATQSTSQIAYTRSLSVGSQGSDVQRLQKFLNARGFTIALTGPGSPGNETNFFGAGTKAALILFQKSQNIVPASGFFGPITQTVINTLISVPTTSNVSTVPTTADVTVGSVKVGLGLGMTDPSVKNLQKFLNKFGFTIALTGPGSPGNETNFFGAGTKAALMKFQEAYAQDILIPSGFTQPTGFVGSATVKKIEALLKGSQ